MVKLVRKKDFHILLWTILAVLLVSCPLWAQDEEVVIMKVILNAEDKGDYFFLLLNDDVAYFKAEDLRKMGLLGIFKNGGDEIDGDTYISLNYLFPRVRFEIDMMASTLNIMADLELLEGNVFDLGYNIPYNVLRTKDRSAFLNYSVKYSLDENLNYTSLGIPWEIGSYSNINGLLGYSNFSYTRSETDEKHVRLNTNITVEKPGSLSRLIIGDFSAFSGDLGSGGSYGGLSLSSNFSTEPFFITSPALDLTLMVMTPAEVEIYINDLLAERRSLPPGQFTFSNLPHATGSGKITIVVKDSYGRTKKYEKFFYTSPTLLKPGVHEYSYNYGLKREEFGQESFEYSDATFLAVHRFGLSQYLTAGFTLETDKDVVNAGTTADFVLGKVGLFKLSVAESYGEKEHGYAGSVGYTYSNKGFTFRLSGKRFTMDYSTLSLTPFQDKPFSETNAGVGFNLGRFGSLSASYSRTDRYIETDTVRTSLFYSKPLSSRLSLYASASRTETEDVIKEASVNLNFYLGKGNSGNLNRRMQENRTSDTVSFQKSAPAGPGLGYRFLAVRDEDEQGESEINGSASIQHNGSFYIFSADYWRTGDQNSYDLNAAGGISFIDGSLHLSRPITDSFALVKVKGLENVKVSANNQFVGRTSSRGNLLVPELISYGNNRLSIDDTDIPVNYEIGEIEKYVSPPLRAGGVVRFDIFKLQGFTGYLFFADKGERIPAEYAGLEIRTEEKLFESVVGKGGEFYLENIPSGRWPARLFLKGRECKFNMSFPESDEIFVDMGEIGCEMD